MVASLDTSQLTPGFDNAVLDAQRCFRAVLWALSRPGMIQEVIAEAPAPAPLSAAAAALALTLIDADAPVWLGKAVDTSPVRAFFRFHCGTSAVDVPEAAAFALCTPSDLDGFYSLNPGHEEYPERSATLVMMVDALEGGDPRLLRGPGVDGEFGIAPRGLPAWFDEAWARNSSAYPLGVDLFLTAGNRLMGLPRSVEMRRV